MHFFFSWTCSSRKVGDMKANLPGCRTTLECTNYYCTCTQVIEMDVIWIPCEIPSVGLIANLLGKGILRSADWRGTSRRGGSSTFSPLLEISRGEKFLSAGNPLSYRYPKFSTERNLSSQWNWCSAFKFTLFSSLSVVSRHGSSPDGYCSSYPRCRADHLPVEFDIPWHRHFRFPLVYLAHSISTSSHMR